MNIYQARVTFEPTLRDRTLVFAVEGNSLAEASAKADETAHAMAHAALAIQWGIRNIELHLAESPQGDIKRG